MDIIYDILLIRTNGLPIFAGCTGSDYCMMHMEQHELQSGLIAALYSFSKEAFNDNTMEAVLFDKIELNFEVDEDRGLILAFIHPPGIDMDHIKEQLKQGMDIFIKHYNDRIKEYIIEEELFEQYAKDLRKLKIIEGKLKDTYNMQVNPNKAPIKSKRSIFGWLKFWQRK